jgi:extracellular factor (EF) 3-hydroxypalmitic acid methyl ester biosynthesis protein
MRPHQLEADGLQPLLDRVEHSLANAGDDRTPTNQALDDLFLTLHACKLGTSSEGWQAIAEVCRQHPLRTLLHQDPFTQRAFEKPRGYAGDACMMDFIYGAEDGRSPPPMTPTGRRVFDYLTEAPASHGVRSRRAVVAALIDRLADEHPRPHILSIAAGHLREANLSIAVRRQRTGRMVALDTDADSLAEVQACYGGLGVETRVASFHELLGAKPYEGQFDFVYSTGLFDYLSARIGRRLVRAMHRMLRPGGSLLVANFLPSVRDAGYMEAFMDWKLVYRSRQEMIDLTSDLPEAAIKNVQLWSEEALNIIFLRVTRQ